MNDQKLDQGGVKKLVFDTSDLDPYFTQDSLDEPQDATRPHIRSAFTGDGSNLYADVLGDPLKLKDPSGLAMDDETGETVDTYSGGGGGGLAYRFDREFERLTQEIRVDLTEEQRQQCQRAALTAASLNSLGAQDLLQFFGGLSGTDSSTLSLLTGISADIVVGLGGGATIGTYVSGNGGFGTFNTYEFSGGFDVDGGVSAVVLPTSRINGVTFGTEVGGGPIDAFLILGRDRAERRTFSGGGLGLSEGAHISATASIQYTTSTMCNMGN